MNILFKKSISILSLVICGTSYATSFDCNQAKLNVERMICSDYKLNRLDDFLSKNYKIIMNSEMPDNAKYKIKESQAEWVNKRNTCDNNKCIQDMYAQRIDLLWSESFDNIKGRITYVKYSEAMGIIEKEEYEKNHESPAEIVAAFLAKHGNKIHELGFTEKQLKSSVFVETGSYIRYSTLEEYLSLMYELSDFKSLDKIDYKNYLGFRIKVSGQPYSGFILRKEGDELYLAGLVYGDEVIEAVTGGDMRRVASIFMSYATYVINKDKFKR